jgi:hypothetical protein
LRQVDPAHRPQIVAFDKAADLPEPASVAVPGVGLPGLAAASVRRRQA